MKIFVSILVLISFMFMGCASSDEERRGRYPASDGHSSLPKRAVDHDYWAACLKERSEAYCKRRMGR